jgi:trans-aconitate 2-methyltransferase
MNWPKEKPWKRFLESKTPLLCPGIPKFTTNLNPFRYKPFFDLMHLIQEEGITQAVDVGCGTGEQTNILAERFKNTQFTGLDSSAEMLQESKKYKRKNLSFNSATIEDFADDETTWDLIFSNAALQWSDKHQELFPKLIQKLNRGGQLAVQMPFQHQNALNKILVDLISKEPFNAMLDGYVRLSPVLEIDDYAKILFHAGLTDLNLSLKVYPIIAESEGELYDFISGSTLIPYMEKLDSHRQKLLKDEFTKRIKNHFEPFPSIYSFKRLLLYGIKE